jgi:hypothetical protein
MMKNLQFGTLANSDATFRGICVMISDHSSYASMPFQRVTDILLAVQRNQAFGALDDGRLVGLVLWSALTTEVAQQAIAARRLPGPGDLIGNGDALAATAFAGETLDIATLLWSSFVAAHRGRIILYERHRPGNAVPSLFKWIDKSGSRMGADI